MQKIIIFLVLSSTLKSTLAETPDWYIENIEEASNKCLKENEIPPDFAKNLDVEDPKMHSFSLCMAKALNVYNDQTGLDIDRLTYVFYISTKNPMCRKIFVEDCMDKNKDITSDGEKILKVVKCLLDKEQQRGIWNHSYQKCSE